MSGTEPFGSCPSASERNQERSKRPQSIVVRAVEAKRLTSPAQLSRSSRCAQSTGMSTKLPFYDQTTFRWTRRSSSSHRWTARQDAETRLVASVTESVQFVKGARLYTGDADAPLDGGDDRLMSCGHWSIV